MKFINSTQLLNCPSDINGSLHCAVPEKSIANPWKVITFHRGRWVLKVKILEAKYEAKLEFPGGEGSSRKRNSCGGSMDIFLELHIDETRIKQ